MILKFKIAYVISVVSLIFVLQFLLLGCTENNETEVPALTITPLPTLIQKTIPTQTLKPSDTPIPKATPIYIKLGSPFALGCGDGIPRIWSNDSQNGPFKSDKIGLDWGHVDIIVPSGCDAYDVTGELVAPVRGTVSFYLVGKNGDGLQLTMNPGEYPLGIEDALVFAGVENPNLKNISKIIIDMGHVMNVITGPVEGGYPVGDLSDQRPIDDNIAIGYQIFVFYDGIEYALSPTLFPTDGSQWICAQNSPNDCVPEKFDYAP